MILQSSRVKRQLHADLVTILNLHPKIKVEKSTQLHCLPSVSIYVSLLNTNPFG